jgi:hypothetical protein
VSGPVLTQTTHFPEVADGSQQAAWHSYQHGSIYKPLPRRRIFQRPVYQPANNQLTWMSHSVRMPPAIKTSARTTLISSTFMLLHPPHNAAENQLFSASLLYGAAPYPAERRPFGSAAPP